MVYRDPAGSGPEITEVRTGVKGEGAGTSDSWSRAVLEAQRLQAHTLHTWHWPLSAGLSLVCQASSLNFRIKTEPGFAD